MIVLDKIFGPQHITFLATAIVLIVVGTILLSKLVKEEKQRTIALKIIATTMLVLFFVHRIVCVITWPDTDIILAHSFCGTVEFFLALSVLFGKKDNFLLHFFSYIGLPAGLIPVIYAVVLNDGPTILFPATFLSLINHSLLFFLALNCFVLGYIKPDIKKYFAYPIGYGLMMLYGVVIMSLFNRSTACNINNALLTLGALKVNAGMIFIISFVIYSIFIVIYDLVKNKEESFLRKLFKKNK